MIIVAGGAIKIEVNTDGTVTIDCYKGADEKVSCRYDLSPDQADYIGESLIKAGEEAV